VSVEHEAKFPLDDCRDVENALRDIAEQRLPWHLETNTVYDREGTLVATERLLRLRRALDATLTYKEPAPEEAEGVKSRIETECVVENPDAMHAILLGLGYRPSARYEKFRSVWELPEGSVFLDILPFGHFLEIEAAPDAIAPLAQRLGLAPATALAASYHALNRRWRAERGLEPSSDFTFEPAERDRLTTLLGCTAPLQGDTNAD